MERKIKFRAWDTDKKEMGEVTGVTDYEITLRDKEFHIWTTERYYNVIPMQYIGLRDINDIEIYEGDIISFKDYYYDGDEDDEVYGRNSGTVVWKDGKILIENLDHPLSGIVDLMDFDYCDLWERLKGCEVIGNIYENKEKCKI